MIRKTNHLLPVLVKKFITKNKIAHVATISSDGKIPQISTIYYVYCEDMIFFATRPDSIKISNIKVNNKIAMVLTDSARLITLQLSATAEIETEQKMKAKIVRSYNRIANGAVPNEFLPLMKTRGFSIEIVKCKISWFRYSDFSGKKQTMVEGVLE